MKDLKLAGNEWVDNNKLGNRESYVNCFQDGAQFVLDQAKTDYEQWWQETAIYLTTNLTAHKNVSQEAWQAAKLSSMAEFNRMENAWRERYDRDCYPKEPSVKVVRKDFHDQTIQSLQAERKELVECLNNFLKKTEVYLTIYDGDKELRKYRENSLALIEKLKAEK